MREKIISAILFDLTQNLHKEGFPKAFEKFLKEVQDDAMMHALGSVSKELIHHAAVHDTSKETLLLKEALLQFLLSDLRDALYSGNLSKLPSMTKSLLQELLGTYGEAQIGYACADIARSLGASQVALIQSPSQLSSAQKNTMIQDLAKNQTLFFPLFVVRRELVGGVRVLLGDTLFDDTFHSQLRRIFASVS